MIICLYGFLFVGSEVLMTVAVRCTIAWDATPCIPEGFYRRTRYRITKSSLFLLLVCLWTEYWLTPAFGNKSHNILKVFQSFGKYCNVIWAMGFYKTLYLAVGCGWRKTQASLDEPKDRLLSNRCDDVVKETWWMKYFWRSVLERDDEKHLSTLCSEQEMIVPVSEIT
jgi:hypothetical protein